MEHFIKKMFTIPAKQEMCSESMKLRTHVTSNTFGNLFNYYKLPLKLVDKAGISAVSFSLNVRKFVGVDSKQTVLNI